MQSECSQNAAKMQQKFSQNAAKIQSKFILISLSEFPEDGEEIFDQMLKEAETETKQNSNLTDEQRERMEKNKKIAAEKRKARLLAASQDFEKMDQNETKDEDQITFINEDKNEDKITFINENQITNMDEDKEEQQSQVYESRDSTLLA